MPLYLKKKKVKVHKEFEVGKNPTTLQEQGWKSCRIDAHNQWYRRQCWTRTERQPV